MPKVRRLKSYENKRKQYKKQQQQQSSSSSSSISPLKEQELPLKLINNTHTPVVVTKKMRKKRNGI